MTVPTSMFSAAFFALALISGVAMLDRDGRSFADEPRPLPAESRLQSPPTLQELRVRAQLLHEALHATLQIVHHQYYREDEGLAIPAATMKKVFREVEARHQVKLRWLAVNAKAMNNDHEPRNDFERQAVKALSSGQTAHEAVQEGVYRRAATVRLSNECLKCHLPDRTSTADRAAGLLIEFPTTVD